MTQVQRATVHDVDALLPLIWGYWNFEGIVGCEQSRIAGQLQAVLSHPNLGAAWLAIVADAPVGYLLAVYVFSLEHRGITAKVDERFVMPSQGVGTALLASAEAEFLREGCTNVSLQLSRDNDSARAFYYRHGYVRRSAYELLEQPL